MKDCVRSISDYTEAISDIADSTKLSVVPE